MASVYLQNTMLRWEPRTHDVMTPRVLKSVEILILIAVAISSGCRTNAPAASDSSLGLVTDVRLEGFDVLPAEEIQDLRDRIHLKPGDRLTEKAKQAAGTRAVETLQNNGYPYAQVGIGA